jgi:ketosteroid isomerase-like protein
LYVETSEMRVVREMYETSNRGDFERTRDYFHPDAELIVPATLPDPGVYSGRDKLFRWFASWYTTLFDSWRVEILEMSQLGKAVVVEHRLHGRGRASGVEVIQDSASVNTVRDGVIVRAQPQASLEDAVRVAKAEAEVEA